MLIYLFYSLINCGWLTVRQNKQFEVLTWDLLDIHIFFLLHCIRNPLQYEITLYRLAFQAQMNTVWKSSKQLKLLEKIPWPSALLCRRNSDMSSVAAASLTQTTSGPLSRDTRTPCSISGQCSGTKGSSTRAVMKAGIPRKMRASSRRRRWPVPWTHQGRRSRYHWRVDTR